MSLFVSVVIPNYNYGRFLSDAIESVLRQTYRDFEVIVVDDGSTDDSLEIIRRFGTSIQSLRQKNSGVSAARNAGISVSRGDAIAFLDADDIWDQEKLALQVERLRDPRIGLAYCGIDFIDENGNTLATDVEGEEGQILVAHATMRRKTVRSGSSAIVRRTCFDRVGVFDPSLSTSADWDMWRRIATCFEVAFVARPLLKYRVHRFQMHKDLELFERDMLRAVQKMFDDPAAAAVQRYRRASYATVYASLSGAYLHQRRWKSALRFAFLSFLRRPDYLVGRASGFPLRWIRRRGHYSWRDEYGLRQQ